MPEDDPVDDGWDDPAWWTEGQSQPDDPGAVECEQMEQHMRQEHMRHRFAQGRPYDPFRKPEHRKGGY